jgi:hypothetical protein
MASVGGGAELAAAPKPERRDTVSEACTSSRDRFPLHARDVPDDEHPLFDDDE